MSQKFYALKNLLQSTVTEFTPWEVSETRPSKKLKDKNAYIEWCRHLKTEWFFYSGFEGLSEFSRVTGENVAVRMHALVVDYDSPDVSEEEVEKMLARCVKKPTWISTTFSGGKRLVWILEKPILLVGPDWTEKFLKALGKLLKVNRLMAGVDSCYLEPNHYYELGTDWKKVGDVLEDAFICKTIFDLSNKTDWRKETGGTCVPIELVAAEVLERFPGKWAGDFKLGSQGGRFWEETADNPRACIVRETGMQCFTGDIPFVPWGKIFGRAFVEEYETKRVGDAIRDTYFDGNLYWTWTEKRWRALKRIDMLMRLKVSGLSSDSEDGGSEIERALTQIQQTSWVEYAIPVIHNKPGEIYINGDRVLNTSSIVALQPCEREKCDWGQDFAFLAYWLDDFFEDCLQRDTFFAWLRRFYVGALEQNPRQGHVMLIGGPPDKGKTLLNTKVVGAMVGGSVDASDLLSGEEKNFNSLYMGSPVWSIDDSSPSTSNAKFVAYSSMLKKIAANRMFVYKKKFADNSMTTWNGRAIITFNLDAESTRVIPEPDAATLDKCILLRARDKKINFPVDVESVLKMELPYFCRWLLNWVAPDYVVGRSRFGVKAYHHKELLDSARGQSASSGFAEILDRVMCSETSDFEGSATELLEIINVNDGLKDLVRGISIDNVGRHLSKLSARGYNIVNLSAICGRKGGITRWKIGRDIQPELERGLVDNGIACNE